jgi:hypothetical protein
MERLAIGKRFMIRLLRSFSVSQLMAAPKTQAKEGLNGPPATEAKVDAMWSKLGL